jgi:D-lactate dehydrogenase (cytochrome)
VWQTKLLNITLAMFRLPAARLRQLASPLLQRGAFRNQANAVEHTVKSKSIQKPFWTSSKVLLFTALTGSTTYVYGANDNTSTSLLQIPWTKSSKPHYASKRDMEKAGSMTESVIRLLTVSIGNCGAEVHARI